MTVKSWLSDGDFYINNDPPNFEIYAQNSAEFKKCLSLDGFRFASHAAQSVYEMERTQGYSQMTSWRIIKLYYASFFAAHAILRFFGHSFSHLELGHIRHLKGRCLSEAGYEPELMATYYLLSFNDNDSTIKFKRCSESHKDLWRSFHGILEEISQIVLRARASEFRRQELSAKIEVLKDAITYNSRFPAGNWLSAFRNEVNYKSLQGAWFPFSRTTPRFEEVLRSFGRWREADADWMDPRLVRSDIGKFFYTAGTIVDLALAVSFDYKKLISKSGRRTADFGKLIELSFADRN